jgi:hypothetical protein
MLIKPIMNKIFITLLICIVTCKAIAQTNPATPTPGEEPYGKVNMDELTMKDCDFEKNANAEVLFDVGIIKAFPRLNMERHIRIKVFTDRGTHKGEFRIRVQNDGGGNPITDLQAETFNLEDGKVQITNFDKKTLYFSKVDQQTKEVSFAVPNIKPGSVFEIKYVSTQLPYAWFFQDNIPTRFSQLETDYLARGNVRTMPHVRQSFAVDNKLSDNDKQIRVMVNVHSLPDEIYMTSAKDNLERIEIYPDLLMGHTWDLIGRALLNYEHFGSEFEQSLAGEGAIIKHAKSLPSDDQKIAFIFDTVRNAMKWDGMTNFFAYDAITKAWNKRSGNSAEINLVLFNLLRRADINAQPMVVSTRNNGKMTPAFPNFLGFNNMVVYIPVDTSKFYVLDASDKNSMYNTIPFDNLDSFGLAIKDLVKGTTSLVPIENDESVLQSVFLNAEISADGKMSGSAEITSDAYNKIATEQKFKAAGEQKYVDSLPKGDNNIKITSFKMENIDVDTLPLVQKIGYNITLSGSDENYIYFNPNLFSFLKENPFKSENRYSDIDMGYRDNFSISGIFKVPAGFKVDALPKPVTIVMPDGSILFKRTIAEDSGTITVRYVVNHKKTVYFTDDYQDLRGFYKKMYELLNEQVILKKG